MYSKIRKLRITKSVFTSTNRLSLELLVSLKKLTMRDTKKTIEMNTSKYRIGRSAQISLAPRRRKLNAMSKKHHALTARMGTS